MYYHEYFLYLKLFKNVRVTDIHMLYVVDADADAEKEY